VAVITGYASLQTSVADWLARSTASLAGYVPNFIQNWEERFYRQPKNFGRHMEASFAGTIASSVLAVPTRYLGLKYAYVNTTPSRRLDRVSLNQLYGSYPRNGDTGCPRWIARDLETFVFGPAPDSTYDIAGVYYAKPTLMRDAASDAVAHWIILNAPDLALYGALLEASPFLRNDARIAVWDSFYGKALQDYQDLNRDEDVSGSPVQEVLG
jgi:hypothetical protein